MLTGESVKKIVALCGNERETTLKEMFHLLDFFNIKHSKQRIEVSDKSQLPQVCLLSLETPRCWHWSLYFDGVFYDPEHGVLDDFPTSNRKYYWEIYT